MASKRCSLTLHLLLFGGRRGTIDESEQRVSKNKANALPEKPGVYLMKDQHNEVLYVGKAKSLKQRVVSYFRKPAACQ